MAEKIKTNAIRLLENAGVIEVENPGNYPYSERTAAHRKGISRYLPAPSVKFSGDCSRNRIFAGELPGGGKIFGLIDFEDSAVCFSKSI